MMREKTLLFWFAIAVQAIVRDANGQATRLQPVTGIIAARDLPTPSQQQNRGQFYALLSLRLGTLHQRDQTLTGFAPLPNLS